MGEGAGGSLAALDQVGRHGPGGGGPGEIDLATAGGRCGQARWGRWWRRQGGRAGGIGVRAQAAGSAGLDPIAVARGGGEPGVAIRGSGGGPDLGEGAGGSLAALDQVGRHGPGGGGPGEIDLATAGGRCGQARWGRWWRRQGGRAGGIGVRARAAGSAGLDAIGVARGGGEAGGVAVGRARHGGDRGEGAGGGLAALDQVAGHGAGGGGPGEIDLATAGGRCGQAGRCGRWRRVHDERDRGGMRQAATDTGDRDRIGPGRRARARRHRERG